MNASGGTPTVLVVDDEQEVADGYALRLRSEYDTSTAHGGQEALTKVDESIDVVLLDRRMPDLSGDEVLERIREQELDCRVIMTTAVDPDFDIVEMPFDDYLCKPVDADDLIAAIDQQLTAERYDDRMDEYLKLISKITLLEGEKTSHELDESADIDTLRTRAEELEAEMDGALDEFDEIETVFREICRTPA